MARDQPSDAALIAPPCPPVLRARSDRIRITRGALFASSHPSPDIAVSAAFRFSFDREVLGSIPAWEALRESHHRIGSQKAWWFPHQGLSPYFRHHPRRSRRAARRTG